jgi:hypothetical protein
VIPVFDFGARLIIFILFALRITILIHVFDMGSGLVFPKFRIDAYRVADIFFGQESGRWFWQQLFRFSF